MTNPADWEIVPSRPRDLDRVVRALESAFSADPFVTWLLGGEEGFRKRGPRFFRAFAEESVRNGWTDLLVPVDSGPDEPVSGLMVWTPPGVGTSTLAQLRNLPKVTRAMGTRLPMGIRVGMGLSTHRQTDPHWYLGFAGVLPGATGGGLGSLLMAKGLERVDEQRMPALLESSNPRNITFYERHGFEVYKETGSVAGSPTETIMWRPAQAAEG